MNADAPRRRPPICRGAAGVVAYGPMRDNGNRLTEGSLLRGVLGRGRRSRRLVRAIDRLPPKVAHLLLRLWAVGRDRLGFDVTIELDALPGGNWDIGFVEVTPSGARLVRTEFVLKQEQLS